MFRPQVLKELIEDSGLSFRQNSVSYIFTCPRCTKKNKLYIRKRDGRFVCWYCKEIANFQGRCEFALVELLGQPLGDLRAKLYDGVEACEFYLDPGLLAFDDDGFGEDEDIIEKEAAVRLPNLIWPRNAFELGDWRGKKGAVYLESRGIPAAIAKEYGVRYSTEDGRVLFPVYVEGRLVGWQGRLIASHEWTTEDGEIRTVPKVLSSKGIPRDHVVMFADRLKGYDHAVICEGPVDAIKAHLCGGNVATMGKAVSRGQIEYIRNSGARKIYLALDPDAAAEASRLAQEFSDLEVRLMTPPAPYKDLGEMAMEDVYRLFLAAPLVTTGQLFGFLRPDVLGW